MEKKIKILSKLGDSKGRVYYECGPVNFIDLMRHSLPKEQFVGFCKGNAMKYLFRYEKRYGLKDLAKAQQYITWLMEIEK